MNTLSSDRNSGRQPSSQEEYGGKYVIWQQSWLFFVFEKSLSSCTSNLIFRLRLDPNKTRLSSP